MIKKIILPITIITFLLTDCKSKAYKREFIDGLVAYEKGDYVKAYRIFKETCRNETYPKNCVIIHSNFSTPNFRFIS